jgi:hypothetical protein
MTENAAEDRILSTAQLIMLNDRAIKNGYNKSLDPDTLERLADPAGLHMLIQLMVHEHKHGQPTEPHLRCRVLVKERDQALPNPAFLLLDVDFEDFRSLTTIGAMRLPSASTLQKDNRHAGQ